MGVGSGFRLRIETLLWIFGIGAILSLILSVMGSLVGVERQGRIVNELADFNLPLTDEMCRISYLLGKQRALLGLEEDSSFERHSEKIVFHLENIGRYLKQKEGASQKEQILLSRLREEFSSFKRQYQDFNQKARAYFDSPSPEKRKELGQYFQVLDKKTDSFLKALSDLNREMKRLSEEKTQSSRRTSLLVFVASLIFLLVFGGWVLRVFRRNVADYRARMQDLAEGEADLTKRVAITGNTELDEAAVYANRFLDKIHGLIRELRETAERLSGETRRLAEAFGISVKGAEKGLAQSRKSREFALELEQEITSMAAAMEEMSATISEISRNTQETSLRARESREAAEITAQLAAELQEASRNIREMSDLIGTVAEQTKLLALNATIEAARAGEAGKGFAVVANEVKELARQSSELVEKINQAVEGLLTKVDEVTQASERNREAANAIAEMAQSVAAAVEEQSTVVNDLSANLVRITEKSKELSKEAEEMERLSQNILDEARKLNTDELVKIGEELERLLSSFRV